jgi:hypothetical protein
MICYTCEKIGECSIFQNLYKISNDFHIDDCKDYIEVSKYKYRKIAEHDDLMALIYDYFTNQVNIEDIGEEYTYEEIKDVITRAMWQL